MTYGPPDVPDESVFTLYERWQEEVASWRSSPDQSTLRVVDGRVEAEYSWLEYNVLGAPVIGETATVTEIQRYRMPTVMVHRTIMLKALEKALESYGK